ncbi:MAG TPA: branched-chain amino acid ABC transporter permease, partial [Hyphomicrobiaceae bacterium]|nr:branched-chain amino acid ABC transporter permease [Hyphomicrobiaceae bacterium]
TTILLFLLQDGVTNGAIYALLALAMVLVFAVTRVILVPQGELVTYGALTLAVLDTGRVPGTVGLLVVFATLALFVEAWSQRKRLSAKIGLRLALTYVLPPLLISGLAWWMAPLQLGPLPQALLAIAIVAPMGPYMYRVAFQPLAEASVLVLLIAAVGAHFTMTGLSLLFFGPEGMRASPLLTSGFNAGPIPVSGQGVAIGAAAIALMAGLYGFFGSTLLGKALRATAVNRLGARLVGVRTALSGQIAFLIAAAIGALSGVLIAPVTTVFYDSGFLIGLKGFVAAIVGGLISYPLAAGAAVFVGIVEAFASFYASSFKEIIVFMLIIPVLIVRSLTTTHTEDEE